MLVIDLHVHESCMRVAVRVLHPCAFILVLQTNIPLSLFSKYLVTFPTISANSIESSVYREGRSP